MDSDEPPPGLLYARAGQTLSVIYTLFVWLISHQPVVLYPQNKPATGNQPAVLLSQNKPAPAISHWSLWKERNRCVHHKVSLVAIAPLILEDAR
jgi:hypothetical protein